MALADVAETWATDPTALVGWRTARARALVRLGDVERADRLGRQAVSLAEQTDSSDLRANALLHLAEVLRLSGRPNEAQPFERRAFRLLDRTGASAQAAAVFRNLSPESDAPSPGIADERRRVLQVLGVLAGENKNIGWFSEGKDLRMRSVGAQEATVQLPREIPVGGVSPLAGQEAIVLATTGKLHAGCGVDCQATNFQPCGVLVQTLR